MRIEDYPRFSKKREKWESRTVPDSHYEESMGKFKEKYIADMAFYKYAFAFTLPMIMREVITNFVSMIDNVMVGRVGTAQMSGVSIANQLFFVFSLTIFGGVSGAGIFGTQFFGKGDHEGHKYTFRFRFLLTILVFFVSSLIFYFGSEWLVSLFLEADDNPELAAGTLKYGVQYLRMMIWGQLPFAVGQAYASCVREIGETKIPMYASMTAIGVNIVLDYTLIFGKFGMPCLGVIGAAIATVVAKYIEAGVIIIWAHKNLNKNRYLEGAFDSMYIPGKLTMDIVKKGLPLLVNEFLWSLGLAVIAQCYSVRSTELVASRNIANTITNMFNVVFIQAGVALGIMVGAKLGAGKMKEARSTFEKLKVFNLGLSLLVSLVLLPIAKYFPLIYKTEPSIQEMATFLILIQALASPMWAYTNVCYFALRSGGRTGITFLFDFTFSWVIQIPLAFWLARYSTVEIHMMAVLIIFSEIIKVVAGYLLTRSNIWMLNIVEEER